MPSSNINLQPPTSMTSPDEASGPWLEIAVEVAGIDAEIAADLLRQACPGGVAIETPSRLDRATETYVPDGDATSLVKGYVRPADDVERLRRNLEIALQAAPLQHPAVWHETRELADEDWRDAWKKYFGILRVGRRLVIVPSWVEHRAKPDDVILRIDPGMAFGTGQHPTTAMCLAALEDALSTSGGSSAAADQADGGAGRGDRARGTNVLDLGCGSGILAIAAAKLGAAHVVAIDIDPQAIKATRANAADNGVEIDSREGTLEPVSEQFDIVVANISGLTLERLAPLLFEALRPGGRLIASGFLEDALDGLIAAFTAAGLTVERMVEDGIWRAIIARRP
jgi:ribosomal protein L11 methyltransferase